MRTRSITAIVIVMAATAVACGGGDDDGSGDAETPSTDVAVTAPATPVTATATAATAAIVTPPTTAPGAMDEPSAATTLDPTMQHFDSDFAQVCRGTGVDWATAYDPANSGPHKVVVLQGPGESDLVPTMTFNDEWDVMFDANSDAYAQVELVACAIRTAEELAQTCTGYQEDGVDTGNTVEYYSATYEVTLREATTAEVVAETTVDASADTCPMLVFFDEGETTATEYADVDVNDFLLEYATT